MSFRRLPLLVLSVLGVCVPATPEVWSLAFVHTHTGESITVDFKRDGVYVDAGVERLTRFLRDHRNGERHEVDPKLFDILYQIRRRVGIDAPFHLVSGYRSPQTNDMLRRTTSGVAKSSLHTHGKALDVRLPGVDTKRLRDIALSLKEGGVGYYAKSNFIHVDTGRVRRW